MSSDDSKPVARDLKKVYQSATVEEAALDEFAQAWDTKYPTIAKQWRAKWADIITLFDFPPPIRKAIYTTGAIESVNSVIRKFTKNRKIYPNEESALKLIYRADIGLRLIAKLRIATRTQIACRARAKCRMHPPHLPPFAAICDQFGSLLPRLDQSPKSPLLPFRFDQAILAPGGSSHEPT